MSAAGAVRPPRRQRWAIVVGGTVNTAGYVEWSDRETADTHVQHLTHVSDIRDRASLVARRLGGRVPVCVYAVPRRGAKRAPTPTWFYDPRGLPEAWARHAPAPSAAATDPCAPTPAARVGAAPTRDQIRAEARDIARMLLAHPTDSDVDAVEGALLDFADVVRGTGVVS